MSISKPESPLLTRRMKEKANRLAKERMVYLSRLAHVLSEEELIEWVILKHKYPTKKKIIKNPAATKAKNLSSITIKPHKTLDPITQYDSANHKLAYKRAYDPLFRATNNYRNKLYCLKKRIKNADYTFNKEKIEHEFAKDSLIIELDDGQNIIGIPVTKLYKYLPIGRALTTKYINNQVLPPPRYSGYPIRARKSTVRGSFYTVNEIKLLSKTFVKARIHSYNFLDDEKSELYLKRAIWKHYMKDKIHD